jgi:anti-sigma regulatory factor (Ser/Thr protein kinase)
MSTVRLSFTPDPAYVRTVRLVAAAVARRAGVAVELLDEIRLATGEACSRAITRHRKYGLTDLIDVSLSDGGKFTVQVFDHGPSTGGRVIDEDETEELAGVGLALLTALVSDLIVTGTAGGTGTEIRMSWPVSR